MAISADTKEIILEGIRATEVLFYITGASILTVCAGFFGFSRVKKLLDDKKAERAERFEAFLKEYHSAPSSEKAWAKHEAREQREQRLYLAHENRSRRRGR